LIPPKAGSLEVDILGLYTMRIILMLIIGAILASLIYGFLSGEGFNPVPALIREANNFLNK